MREGNPWRRHVLGESTRYGGHSGERADATGGLAPGRDHGIPGRDLPAPRSWATRVYPNLVYFNEVDRGGHFAAWEEPDLFAEEMRAAFKSLR
jgi:pimeloyl-ACP methyl ester carboxylesterase